MTDAINEARERVINEFCRFMLAGQGSVEQATVATAALDALIAVVQREQAASMPCLMEDRGGCPSSIPDARCDTCSARAKKADAKEEA